MFIKNEISFRGFFFNFINTFNKLNKSLMKQALILSPPPQKAFNVPVEGII